MRRKFAICKMIILITLIFSAVVNAGEIYRWVDENGVTRFSDSPPDRNALIKNNTKSSPAIEPKTSAQTVSPVATVVCPESDALANPFLGKWQGEWAKGKFKGPLSYDSYNHKAVMVVRNDCKLEYQYEGESRREYRYKIREDYLLGNGEVENLSSGVPSTLWRFSFKLTKEGKLEGTTFPRIDSWGCLFEKVP